MSDQTNNEKKDNVSITSLNDLIDFIRSTNIITTSKGDDSSILKFNEKDKFSIYLNKIEDEDIQSFEKLQKDLDLAKKEVNEKLLRMAADFDNYKKRNQIEKSQATFAAKENMLRDLLFFIDNFDRGLSLYHDTDKNSDFYKGMVSVQKDFLNFIEKNNINKIELNRGDEFDPNFHQALELKNSDEFENNKIIEVVQSGYTLDNKILRPALVIVSSGVENEQ
jgi:molecular chaperone GrpE